MSRCTLPAQALFERICGRWELKALPIRDAADAEMHAIEEEKKALTKPKFSEMTKEELYNTGSVALEKITLLEVEENPVTDGDGALAEI